MSAHEREREVGPRPFPDRVAALVERKRTQLVVGLDPRIDLLPIELRGDAAGGRPAASAAVERFCCGVIDAVSPYVVAVKPQLAFFEALGADGWGRSSGSAHMRPTQGSSSSPTGNAGTSVQPPGPTRQRSSSPSRQQGALADALTVNPLLGEDSIDPFLSACRRYGSGLFVLVHTSNAGATDIQEVSLADGRPLWHHIAELVASWGDGLVAECGLSSVGAVVGATYPRAIGEARRAMPQAIILLPGIGAQGATPADVARAFTSGPASALVTASRSVIYAYRDTELDWREAAAAEAARLAGEIWQAAGW